MAHISRLAAAGALQAALENKPYILAQSAVPYGIANSGTIATDGTVTLGTALSTTYYGGIWLYFPAAAFASGSAGFYWTVMSSTTAGVVYTSRTSGTPVTGSNSAYTGSTSAQSAVTVTIPGGEIGANGSIRHYSAASINSTAGVKTLATFLGGSNIGSVAGTTSTNISIALLTTNRNSASSQRSSSYLSSLGTSVGSFSAVDTTADQALTFRLQLAVATDVVVLENYLVEVMPGA